MAVAPAQVFVYIGFSVTRGVARHSRTNADSVDIAVKSTARVKVLSFGRNRMEQSSTFQMKTLKMTFAVPLEMPNSVLSGFGQSFNLKHFKYRISPIKSHVRGVRRFLFFFPSSERIRLHCA